MPAYVIGQIRVLDQVKWQEYVSQVGATILLNGGHIEFRGDLVEKYSGNPAFDSVVVLRFGDAAAARRWHDSPAYQRLIALRDSAADVTLFCVEA